jgi:predicted homoserine dehydrogenase-like protein
VITHPLGSFDLRGEAILLKQHPLAVPLGVLNGARLKHTIEPGQMLTYADVELPESDLVRAVLTVRDRSLQS